MAGVSASLSVGAQHTSVRGRLVYASAVQRTGQATYGQDYRRSGSTPARRPTYGAPATPSPTPASKAGAPAPARGGAPARKQHQPLPHVTLAAVVPECRLPFGEQLVLVGSCPELGGWDVGAAPRLSWTPDDTWVATLALPPGLHTFKLVVVRQDGCAYWEEGPDRELEVPEGAAAVAAKARTGLKLSCRFGDWAPVDVTLASAADLAALAVSAAPAAAAGSAPGAPAAGGAFAASPGGAAPPAGAGEAPAEGLGADALARAARLLEPDRPPSAGPAQQKLAVAAV